MVMRVTLYSVMPVRKDDAIPRLSTGRMPAHVLILSRLVQCAISHAARPGRFPT